MTMPKPASMVQMPKPTAATTVPVSMPAPATGMPKPATTALAPAMPMPKPKPVTFGDLRPEKKSPVARKPFEPAKKGRRAFKPDAKPMGHIQTYRQTGGPLYLHRFAYNGVWITGTAESEQAAIDSAQQFYMHETKQGRLDSVEVAE